MDSKPIKKSGPLALGIHWAHDASAAICSPKGVLCVIQEERLNRIKHYYGFPCQAIEYALKYCGLTAADIDYVAFSTSSVLFPEHTEYFSVSADGSMKIGKRAVNITDELRKRRAKQQKNVIAAWGEEFAKRHYSMKLEYVSDLGLMDERIIHYYVSHHRAHAASAFRFSGLDEACVITMDGKGDGLSATIYKGHSDGRLELLRSSPAVESLGSFYQAVTEALGFIPVDGEYKTMGLAALGRENGTRNPFESIIQVKDGAFKSSIPWTYRDFNKFNPEKKVPNPLSSVAETDNFKGLLRDMSGEQFAYFAQQHCEENMLLYVRDAMQLSKCDKIAAAGGVMLNVKANARIRDTLKPSAFFIYPDAADSGLAAGAAMEALHHAGCLNNPVTFLDPYMGHSFTEEEVYKEILNYKDKYGMSVIDGYPSVIAEFLASGKVIGVFQGRLEMGPRALGNRSVLADARSESVKDRINLLLKGREWFVPFAPAVLNDDAPLYWDGPYDYRYMTFAVTANDYAKKNVPGIVHVDGTMRPQVVTETSNSLLHNVLREFKKRTGVGVLINTSFNRHGLPIVGRPSDALDHLVNGWVDGVFIGKWYVEKRKTP